MPIPLVNVGALLDPGLTSASPELEVVVAPGTHPLALLPVRLETRYFDAPDGQTELRVPHLPRPDPHRLPRPRAHGGGGGGRAGLLGAGLARGGRRGAGEGGVAAPDRAARARPGGVRRAHA